MLDYQHLCKLKVGLLIVQNFQNMLRLTRNLLFWRHVSDERSFLLQNPAYIWSEEYQIEVFSEHFKAFDNLRKKNFFIGEMIWNFADFNTAQSKIIIKHPRVSPLTIQRLRTREKRLF